MAVPPSANGWTDTRDARGRFGRGNAGGPGNPHAAAVARLRAAMLETVTPEDFAEIARVLVRAAKGGDLAAAQFLFDRALGKPPTAPDLSVRAEADPVDLDDDALVQALAAAGVPLPPEIALRWEARGALPPGGKT